VATSASSVSRFPVALKSRTHFFQRLILSPPGHLERNVTPKRESHERIAKAQKIAEMHVVGLAGTTNDPTSLLLNLVLYLAKKAKVIHVRVPDHANAFTIFETLNDRGLDLTIADLLKNYLFGRSENRIDEVQARWSAMLGALDTVGGEEIVLTYLRHLWSSLYGPTREKLLYGDVKKRVSSKQKAIDFSCQLEDSAKKYAAILNPYHELWAEYGPTARNHVETLVQLKLEQFKPLLLAILENFSTKEVSASLKYLVSCSVRFLVVGGLGGGTMEKVYADAAVAVRAGDLKNAKLLATHMAKHVPTDAEFESAFATARVSQGYLARYYLCALERRILGQLQPEYVPNQNADEVNLEHVLPETPSPEWGNISEEVARAYYKRLGNLTLMKAKINSEIGNKGFQAKREVYKASQLRLTEALAANTEWGPKQIDARQKDLSKKAVETWSIVVAGG
jgi:hypothetical protein